MSRLFRDKNKNLINLEVVSARDVWTKDKKGKPILRNDIKMTKKMRARKVPRDCAYFYHNPGL